MKRLKKYICIFTSFALALTLCACGNKKEDNKDSESSSTAITAVTEESSSQAEQGSAADSDTQSAPGSDESSSPDPGQDESSQAETAAPAPTIDKQVIWKADGIKVTAEGLNYGGILGTELNLTVKNTTKKNITVATNAVIVNDYMINDLTGIDVAAGSTAEGSVSLMSSELEAAGIDVIGSIELYLHIYDSDTFDTIADSECITLKTPEKGKTKSMTEAQGTTVLDKDGVRIMAQYVDDDTWGKALLVYTENGTDKLIAADCDKVKINGVEVDCLFYSEVYPGKRSVDSLTFFSSLLEEKGIKEIKTIEVSFEVDDENYNTIIKGKKVNLAVST